MHRRRLSVSSAAICAVLLGFTTVSCSGTANQVNAKSSAGSGTGTVSASSSQGSGTDAATSPASGGSGTVTGLPGGSGPTGSSSAPGEQFLFPGAAEFDGAVLAGAAEFTDSPAEHRSRNGNGHTGTERDDVPCGGRDGCDRGPVPVPLGPDVVQPVGPGARDIADVHRVPPGYDMHGAAADVPGAGPGDGADHAVPELVRGDAAVRHADGDGAVRGDDRRGVRRPRPGPERPGPGRVGLVPACRQLLLRQGCEGAGGGP